MTITSGYHCKFITGTGTGTVAYNFVTVPESYVMRIASPISPKFSSGPTDYLRYDMWNVAAYGTFKSGIGWDTWQDGGLYSGIGVDAAGGPLTLAPGTAIESTTLGGVAVKFTMFTTTGGNTLYLAAGKTVSSWVESSSGFSSSKSNFATTVSDMETFGASMWVTQGTAQPIWQLSSAGSWSSQSKSASLLQRVAQTLWASFGSAVASSADGTTWGTNIPTGLSATNITALEVYDGELFCAKPEGLYKIQDNTDCVEVLPFTNFHNSNGVGMCEWQGALYIPVGNALWRWTPSVVKDVSPAKLSGGLYGFDGEVWARPACLAPGPTALYAGVNPPDIGYVMVYDGTSWHCWGNAFNGGIINTMIHVTDTWGGATTKRRLFCDSNVLGDVWFAVIELPTYTDDLTRVHPTAFTYQGITSTATFPWLDGGTKMLTKYFAKGEILVDDVSTARTVIVSYRTNSTASFTNLVTVSSGKIVPFTIGVNAQRMQFRLALANGATAASTSTDTPIVRGFAVYYTPYITPRCRSWILPIPTGKMKLRDGCEADVDPLTTYATLMSMWNTTGPIVYEDWLTQGCSPTTCSVNVVNVIPMIQRDGMGDEELNISYQVHLVELAAPAQSTTVS